MDFWRKALHFADVNYSTFCFITNNGIVAKGGSFPVKLALGRINQISVFENAGFDEFKAFQQNSSSPIFGILGYDLKNELEGMQSFNPDHLNFPDLFFTAPQVVLESVNNKPEVSFGTRDTLKKIDDFYLPAVINKKISHSEIRCRFKRNEYIETVQKIRQHIQRGDIYEANFCIEFFVEELEIDPVTTFLELSEISPMPFSALIKIDQKYIICASPERYLKKEGNVITSQPIKGTIRRGKDEAEDQLLKEKLITSEKEKAENIMIVDLVRNDLSRVAANGSVKVKELNKLYSFQQVHQLISTVEATLDSKFDLIDAIKFSFPMGSMTGAPKIKAMELIDKYEKTKRGVFSGAIGFITPEGDFDFNVVIRSLLYDRETKYGSFQAGSAITIDADPEKEWEECLVKTKAIRQVLTGEIIP